LDGGTTHWLRPRIIGYVLVLCIMTAVFWYNMFSRVPLELTAIRDRNQLYVTTDTGAIDNIYILQLANMDRDQHEFVITISGIEGAGIIGETSHTLDGGVLDKPSTELDFTVAATDRPSLQITSESRFMKPL
jgi:polyferredoxin